MNILGVGIDAITVNSLCSDHENKHLMKNIQLRNKSVTNEHNK